MFKCVNCGQCCNDIATQINLTIGDILRISEYTKIPIKKLFEKHISINPFGDPFNNHLFDLEMGLNIPCEFRKRNKCTIYDVRSLNCRIFPYWILAEAPSHEIKKIIELDHKCMDNFEFSVFDRPRYYDFKAKIVRIMLKETALTDEMMKKNGFVKKVNIKKNEQYKRIMSDKSLSAKEKDVLKIKLVKSMMKLSVYSSLPSILEEYKTNRRSEFATMEELQDIQVVLKNKS